MTENKQTRHDTCSSTVKKPQTEKRPQLKRSTLFPLNSGLSSLSVSTTCRQSFITGCSKMNRKPKTSDCVCIFCWDCGCNAFDASKAVIRMSYLCLCTDHRWAWITRHEYCRLPEVFRNFQQRKHFALQFDLVDRKCLDIELHVSQRWNVTENDKHK